MPSKSKKTKSSQLGPVSRPAPAPMAAALQASTPTEPRSDYVPAPPPPPPPPLVEHDSRTGDTTESAGEPTPGRSSTRKKQKRREKDAAKRTGEPQGPVVNGHPESAAEAQHPNGQRGAMRPGRGPAKGYFTEETDYVDPDFQTHLADEDEDEDEFYSHDDDLDDAQEYGPGPDPDQSWLNTSKRKKTAKKRHRPAAAPSSAALAQRPFPTLSNAALRSAHKMSHANDHIWNTSTQAERENIKQFWLELGEDERRSLVRVEKEAVLRKMKEQQKHSCSCSVCGRKRTAIEEELEVLYDAYYQELEQFANHDDDRLPARPPSASRSHASRRMAGAYPVHARAQALAEDEDELEDEDEYDDDEEEEEDEDEDDEDDDEDEDDDDDEDDEYSDGYDVDELPPGPPDFFQFGNSLTVKDGILTVADDLLKNDGKHFIDMMEQLAEKRMQREEEILYPAPPLAHQASHQGHNHPPLDEDDDYDEDDDEDEDDDYDSQDEEDFDADDMDSMTEEQRMEEGRRMFQIFAARMFEQRVLTAYKEKVAAERQKKLLEELEAEEDKTAQREAKKAKDAAKKKEKKARQKAAKDEERAKKEAEKAATEAAAREAEAKKLAEKRAKQEEQRKKREAERKAAEEEKARKDAERAARLQKERERQHEAERKAKEAKEREKQRRDEQRKREREERELKEAEARERRVQEDHGRKDRHPHPHPRKDKDPGAKPEKEARERAKGDLAARPQPIALPPGLAPASRPSTVQSPQIPAATPLIPPHVPTPARTRQPSQPSHSSSPRSQKASTDASRTSASPANPPPPPPPPPPLSTMTHHPPKPVRPGPPLHHPQPSAPRSPLNNMGPSTGRGGHFHHLYGTMHGVAINGVPANPPAHLPMNAPAPLYPGPPAGNPHRPPPNSMGYPPGFHASRPYGPHPHGPYAPPASGAGPIVPPPMPPATSHPSHSRQPSGAEPAPPPAPIARPGPIARPSSTTPDKPRGHPSRGDPDVDQIATQLGSSALLDDSDAPFGAQLEHRPHLPAPLGPPGTGRLPFASFAEKPTPFGLPGANWGGFTSAPGTHFGQVPRAAPGWSQPMFDSVGPQPGLGRSHVPRPIAVRLLLVQACRQLSAAPSGKGDGSYLAHQVLRQVEQIQPPGDAAVSMEEMLGICDTEGNVQNGGGTFEVMMDPARGQVIRFVEDSKAGTGARGGVGDIGAPAPAPIAAPGAPFGSIGQGVQAHGPAYRHGPPGRQF